ncbi:hypothetical protein Pmani_004845 [Petrolisthes manimaculis]|uniref:Uncharacterized protein n=1 Tax=Petrolisthes manimaculis TaxID=1843537 RepID=A0AAE1UH64_9EUCA|nr:hypothetical protein Pmani_004845 [Petrolisthes manimaculis]
MPISAPSPQQPHPTSHSPSSCAIKYCLYMEDTGAAVGAPYMEVEAVLLDLLSPTGYLAHPVPDSEQQQFGTQVKSWLMEKGRAHKSTHCVPEGTHCLAGWW